MKLTYLHCYADDLWEGYEKNGLLREHFGIRFPRAIKLVCTELAEQNLPNGVRVESLQYVNEVFSEFAKEGNNITIFHPETYPNYDKKIRGYGLFEKDLVYFTAEVNQWVALEILKMAEKSGG